MDEELYSMVKRNFNYVFWLKEKCKPNERAWYNGYFEALCFISEMIIRYRKEGLVK